MFRKPNESSGFPSWPCLMTPEGNDMNQPSQTHPNLDASFGIAKGPYFFSLSRWPEWPPNGNGSKLGYQMTHRNGYINSWKPSIWSINNFEPTPKSNASVPQLSCRTCVCVLPPFGWLMVWSRHIFAGGLSGTTNQLLHLPTSVELYAQHDMYIYIYVYVYTYICIHTYTAHKSIWCMCFEMNRCV